jgi:MYXO-CTERM domain-containing protein
MLCYRLLPPLVVLLSMPVLLAGPASAHIRLLAPQDRYTEQEKGEGGLCPCGVVVAGRRCRQPAERSDPNRVDQRATALRGGSTLRVRLEEYVGHAGRFRIAFDPDGAELDDFDAHVLTDIPDPAGSAGNIGEGSIWEIEARLPNIACERCTLQVVQTVDGDMLTPLLSPNADSGYFACADLVLTQDPSLPEGYAEPHVVSNDLAAASAEPVGGSATAAAGGAAPVASGALRREGSDGGCSLGTQGPARGVGVLALAALALLARRPRRDKPVQGCVTRCGRGSERTLRRHTAEAR